MFQILSKEVGVGCREYFLGLFSEFRGSGVLDPYSWSAVLQLHNHYSGARFPLNSKK